MPRCARCESSEVFTVGADMLDPQNSADLCVTCGRDFLAAIVAFPGLDLRCFTGTATAAQQRANAAALADHRADMAREAAKLARVRQQEAEADAKAARARGPRGPNKRKGKPTKGSAEAARQQRAKEIAAQTSATAAAIRDRPGKIAELVRERPRTVPEIATALGVSHRTATRALRDARNQGLVSGRTGPGAVVEPVLSPTD